MRTIIAGSRGLTSWHLEQALALCSFADKITTVICGCARGIDRAGEEWALHHDKEIAYYPAQWGIFGKRAGMVRNRAMANDADALVAVWDGKSKGTKNMIEIARELDLEVFVWDQSKQNPQTSST